MRLNFVPILSLSRIRICFLKIIEFVISYVFIFVFLVYRIQDEIYRQLHVCKPRKYGRKSATKHSVSSALESGTIQFQSVCAYGKIGLRREEQNQRMFCPQA